MTEIRHLQAMLRVKLDKVFDDIEKHAHHWNKQRKCECMPKRKRVSKEDLTICKHLLKDREKKYQKTIDYCYNMIGAIGTATINQIRDNHPIKNKR